MTELGEELKGTDREATEKEFADVIASLASLANTMGIDLEKQPSTNTTTNAQNAKAHRANALFSPTVSALNLSPTKHSAYCLSFPRYLRFSEA